MANQSFPPVSVLKALQVLRLELEIPAFADALDRDALESRIKSIVTTSGVTFVDGAARCDALLNAKIMVIASASHADGSPFAMAYVVRLSLLTNLASHPSEELFIVFDDVSFGSTGPMQLSTTINRMVASGAQTLASRLKPTT